MNAMLDMVIAIWLAASAVVLIQPIIMVVMTKAELSMVICSAIGRPIFVRERM